MKKTRYVICLFVLLLLESCQYKVNNPSTQPVSSQTSSLVATMNYAPSPTPTLEVESEKIFVGGENGAYLVFNLEAQQSHSILLPTDCRISRQGQSAICESISGVYVFDLSTGSKTELPFSKPYSWSLPSDQRIDYVQEDGNRLFDLFEYDIVSGSITHLLTFNPQEWALNPIVSNDRKHIIGGRIEDSKIALVEIHPGNDTYTIIGHDILGDITDIIWSPTDPILGVGSTEVTYQDVPPCTTTIFSTYNAMTGETKQIAHSPNGMCYEYFWSGYIRNIWSPDGAKVALIAGQSLCVLDIFEENRQNCFTVTQAEETIKRIAWSPDSQYMAYIIKNRSNGGLSLYKISVGNLSKSILLEHISMNSPIVDFFWSESSSAMSPHP